MIEKDLLSLIIPDGQYDPSEVVLIGSHMDPSPSVAPSKTVGVADLSEDDKNALRSGRMRVRSDFANELVLTAITADEVEGKEISDMDSFPTIALIYAYGYEGHTYRLSKPRIMIVQGAGEPYEATRDQDPSESLTGKLYMWRQSKHQQTISIEVESGELEQLVLEANQPGNRAVNSYAAHMQMSHRGGKLS